MKYLFYDFEIYPNFFLCVFKDREGRKVVIHSMMDFSKPLLRLKSKLDELIFVGFNNIRYDSVMLNYLLKHFMTTTVSTLTKTMYEMSQEIIEQGQYYKKVLGSRGAYFNTLEMDTSTYAPQNVSLKELGCRLHHHTLENLPLPPNTIIEEKHISLLEHYCENDVDITVKVFDEYLGEVESIWEIIDYFGLDKSECSYAIGSVVEKGLADGNLKVTYPSKFRYKPPIEFNFKMQESKDILETFKGLILEPNSSFSLQMQLGDVTIEFGLGGIHGAMPQSQYKNLIDLDVSQFYPEIIDRYDLLASTVSDRGALRSLIEAKERYGREGDTRREKAIKKGINSYYGRTGFDNSKVYSPDKMYSTTITGQLMMLRLAEDLHLAGYEVMYLNTDGLTIVDNGDDNYKEIAKQWQKEFGFKLKEVRFNRAVYRDVNNFIAEEEDGTIKRKGVFNTDITMKRSCFARVSADAVVEYLLHDTNIREYINAHNDMRGFLMYHKYNKDMSVFLYENGDFTPLDNVVRYYLSKDKENAILHQKEGSETFANREINNNVELADVIDDFNKIPSNLDKERYVTIAYDLLEKVTKQQVEDNPYIEDILKKLEVFV